MRAVLALLLPLQAAAQGAGAPALEAYVKQAHEILIGRVVSAQEVRTLASASADGGVRYKHTVSRAVVEVERTIYNASKERKTIFFCSALYLHPDHTLNRVSPDSPNFPWMVGGVHYTSCGMPLALAVGERALFFLYKASAPRYDFILGDRDQGKYRPMPEIDKARKDGYILYSKSDDYDFGGLGAKFALEGPEGEESVVFNAQPRWDEATPAGERVLRGTNSFLVLGDSKRGIDTVRARMAGHQKLPLAQVLETIKEAGTLAPGTPAATLQSAHVWRDMSGIGPNTALVKISVRLANVKDKPLTFRIISYEAATAKGTYQLKGQFGDWGAPVWDGRLEPQREREVRVPASYPFDGEKESSLLIVLEDSLGRKYRLESARVPISDAY